MALKSDVKRCFEDIVSAEHVSDDDVIIDSYSFTWLVEFEPESAPGKFIPNRPEAVILPGSTEEVQAIVKACNRFDIKFKAMSTGYGAHSLPGQKGVVVLDMKRMNRILEIDEKNKYAVVEPYVVWAQLSAEAIKLGLFTTPIQAGSQASVLANVTSGWGMNVMGNHGGHNGRNALGVEWVLPTGELIKLGPAHGWYTGDGPGPSLRGVMRGHVGAQGGMGVFTKAAIKLHNWPGPPKLDTLSTSMAGGYQLKEAIPNLSANVISFDTYEDMSDFLCKAGDANIGYAMIRAGGAEHSLPMGLAGVGNKQIHNLYKSGVLKLADKMLKHPIFVILFTNSENEMKYQKKVLDSLIEESKGTVPPFQSLGAGGKDQGEDMISKTIPIMLVGNDTHFIHHAGGFVIASGYMGTTDSIWRHMGVPQEKLKHKYNEKGKILADGVDCTYHNSFDNNSYVYAEMEFHYDAADPESVESARECVAEERDNNRENKLGFEPNDIGLCLGDANKSLQQRLMDMGPLYGNFHIWQERMKREFDPNDVSDRSNYGTGLLGKDLLQDE